MRSNRKRGHVFGFGNRAAATALALGVAISACSPITHVQGYSPRADELATVQVGLDTRFTVEQKLGRPSTVGSFDDDDWFYISQTTEQLAFYQAEVVDRRVVLISFDPATGIVTEVGNYGLEDGRVIDLVTRTTPTSGRKLTLLQQAFQNVGRFRQIGQ